jgi:hypothetical protein
VTFQQVPNAELRGDTARQNLLTNGGFEIWQRGNGPFSAGLWCADRWTTYLQGGTSTFSISKDTTNIDVGSGACAAVVYTHNVASQMYNGMRLSTEWQHARGRQYTLSVRVRTSTANAVQAMLWYDGGAGETLTGGTFHSGNGVYQTITVTATIPSNATFINVSINFAASCTAYIDNAMLVVGSVAADYVPMHPADDLARCLRYYEKMGNYNGGFVRNWQPAVTGNDTIWYGCVKKAVTPTLTKVGSWQVANCAQPTAGNGTTDGFYITCISSSVGNTYYQCPDTTAGITLEANP